MLLGLSFIMFHTNKMNFFSINFSPLKNEFLRKNEFGLNGGYGFQVILKIMCTWVSFSKFQNWYSQPIFASQTHLPLSTSKFLFLYFIFIYFFYRTSVQIVLQICCFWCYCAWGSKLGNGDDSISGVGGGISRWVAESVLLVLRNRF